MRKYEAPKMQMISRNDLDIICASELLFPIIPLMGGNNPANEEQEI